MKFRRDSEGAATASATSEHLLLANFLQGDLQEDVVTASEVLDQARRVVRHERERYEFIGNAHQLSVTRSQVTLEALNDELTEDCQPEFFIQKLEQWLEFIDSPEPMTSAQ